VKLRELKLNLLGTQLKIQIGSSEKVQQEHPGKVIFPKISEFLTPVIKRKKIGHLNDI